MLLIPAAHRLQVVLVRLPDGGIWVPVAQVSPEGVGLDRESRPTAGGHTAAPLIPDLADEHSVLAIGAEVVDEPVVDRPEPPQPGLPDLLDHLPESVLMLGADEPAVVEGDDVGDPPRRESL